MVVIQGHKTYFVSPRLHLPHGVGEEEPTATFCHINYININGVKCKWKNATYYKSKTACCLFVTEEIDGVNLSVSWLQSRLVQEILFQTVSHSSWHLKLTLWRMTPQYSAAVGLIETFLWHYLMAKAFWREWKVSQWIYFHSEIKECYCTIERILTTRVYFFFSWWRSVTFLLKTYVPSNITLKSHYI